jgi:predicted transcriptional regulator YdeE
LTIITMDKIVKEEFKLTGLKLNRKTTNENGQSSIDCGNLWQRFENENYVERIQGKLSDEIYAVYYDYEGDHTKPFSYFIGCKVKMDTQNSPDLDSLIIPAGTYSKIIAKGAMPGCIANAWKNIWSSITDRAYQFDLEIYDERSKDWSNAEIEIFVSTN